MTNHEYEELEKVTDKIYRRGYDEGYEKGLNEAWEAVRKILSDPIDGGLAYDELLSILGSVYISTIVKEFSASEVIAKIKKYEKQKQNQTNEIKVYDEVYLVEGFPRIATSIFTDSENGKQARTLLPNGNHAVYRVSDLHKTGRSFPELGKILKQLGEEVE